MKRKLAIAFVSACVFLGPHAFAQVPGHGPDGVTPIDPHGDNGPQQAYVPPDPEGKAEELRVAGKCREAIPILRRLEARDHNELSQFNLGQCLLDDSKSEPDGTRAGIEREAAEWLLKAANSGLPNAQSSLIGVYLDGAGVARDPVEAGKWSLLYHSNGTRLAIGMKDIPPDLQARLDSALTNHTWAQAQARADEWTPNDTRVDD